MSLIVAINSQQIVSLLIGDLLAVVQRSDCRTDADRAAKRAAFLLA
jgi:hypothetical protein